MKILKIVSTVIRRALLFLCAVYWAVFIGGSLIAFASGGPSRLSAWYNHVFEGPLAGDCIAGSCTFAYSGWDLLRLGWGGFAVIQFTYLIATLLLCFFEWRSWGRKEAEHG